MDKQAPMRIEDLLPDLDEQEKRRMVDAFNRYFGTLRKMVRQSGGTEQQAAHLFAETFAAVEAAGIPLDDEAHFYQTATLLWKK